MALSFLLSQVWSLLFSSQLTKPRVSTISSVPGPSQRQPLNQLLLRKPMWTLNRTSFMRVNPSFHHRQKTWWMILDYFSPVPLVSRKKKGQGGRKLSWLPLGLYALERREELHFLNGRQYCLTSTICRNPYYTIKDAKSTQTDFSGASMCDVAMKRVDHRTIHP